MIGQWVDRLTRVLLAGVDAGSEARGIAAPQA